MANEVLSIRARHLGSVTDLESSPLGGCPEVAEY